MEALKELINHVENRSSELEEDKSGGRKVVGYLPGGYLPEELVLAAGAVPVCLAHGGSHAAVEQSNAYISRWMDTFCRAQIGYGVSGKDPYYNLIDLLVVPITDNNVRAVSDVIDFNTDIEVFPYGVPHLKDDSAYRYYLHGIGRLKERMEELTGEAITEQRLSEAIILCNRERELLKEISLLRKADPSPLDNRDFVLLNHASLLADKRFMVTTLESVYQSLKTQTSQERKGPRLLLTGSTLAIGDDRILNLIEEAGGVVVMEEFDEGLRPYWENVSLNGHHLEALAESYFMKRVSPAWFRPARERRELLIRLAKDFSVDGVIWYHLLYRDSYKTEAYLFPDKLLKETGLSMMVVESDYDPTEEGPMRTRIETFIHTIGG
ncbi:2-hydroxyacyl-CoA dehydratase subunit D [Thermodesulfobacteriota bacterium]